MTWFLLIMLYFIQRFLPSEFGNDVDRLHAVEPAKSVFATKVQIRRAIEAEGIPYTYVTSNFFAGYFLPTLVQPGATAPPKDKVIILGDGNPKGEQYIFLEMMDEFNFMLYFLFMTTASSLNIPWWWFQTVMVMKGFLAFTIYQQPAANYFLLGENSMKLAACVVEMRTVCVLSNGYWNLDNPSPSSAGQTVGTRNKTFQQFGQPLGYNSAIELWSRLECANDLEWLNQKGPSYPITHYWHSIFKWLWTYSTSFWSNSPFRVCFTGVISPYMEKMTTIACISHLKKKKKKKP